MRHVSHLVVGLLTLASWLPAVTCFVDIPFSKQYFGPDGPWQALSIQVGYFGESLQSINVYPSFLWNYAIIFAPSTKSCASSGSSTCLKAGGVTPLPKKNETQVAYTWYTSGQSYAYNYSGYYDLTMNTKLSPAVQSFADTEVAVCDDSFYRYPSGIQQGTEVGLVTVGGGQTSQIESPEKFLMNFGDVKSDTFSLHIGSAPLQYPGSFIYGGYDKGRLIGNVASYRSNDVVKLKDITIGIETGASPFNFTSKTGLLGPVSDTLGPQNTFVNPANPYIRLPQDVLDGIVKFLPVRFDSASGYYLWQTNDPNYEKVVNSPAYLGFVFSALSAPGGNVTIKVPFPLLKLTLEKSVSTLSKDVPYLPLLAAPKSGYMDTALQSNYAIDLGRAFLQAAFLGGNWGQKILWIGQAPGPGSSGKGLDSHRVNIGNGATSLDSGNDNDMFATSWESHWTVLSSGSSSSLSGGAIAGIVIGVLAVIASAVGIFLFFCLRRRKSRRRGTYQQAISEKKTPDTGDELDSEPRHELYTPTAPGGTRYYDLDKVPKTNAPGELPGDQVAPQELPADNGRYL